MILHLILRIHSMIILYMKMYMKKYLFMLCSLNNYQLRASVKRWSYGNMAFLQRSHNAKLTGMTGRTQSKFYIYGFYHDTALNLIWVQEKH